MMNEIIKFYFEEALKLDKELTHLTTLYNEYKNNSKELPKEFKYKLDEVFIELSHRLEVINDAELTDEYIKFYNNWN